MFLLHILTQSMHLWKYLNNDSLLIIEFLDESRENLEVFGWDFMNALNDFSHFMEEALICTFKFYLNCFSNLFKFTKFLLS